MYPHRVFDQIDTLLCYFVSIVPEMVSYTTGLLLIIAFGLAVKLVEHIRDLNRRKGHVSKMVMTVFFHDKRVYKNLERSLIGIWRSANTESGNFRGALDKT